MKLTIFQGVLLGVFGLGAVIGLIVFATYSGSSGKGVGSVTIWGTLPQQEMQQALTAATQNDQTLKSVSYIEKDSTTFDADLLAAIAAGHGPDMILTSQEDLAALANVIQPIPASSLSARAFASQFTTGAEIWSAGSAGSYGIPYLIDPLVLYANQGILASAGIAQTPSTWEALTGLVPKVAAAGQGGKLSRELIALGTYANVSDARAILSALFLQGGAPIAVREQSGFIAADLGEQAQEGTPPGEAVVRFYTQFADPTKVSYTWNASLPASEQAFAAGDLALYLGYASEASYFSAANPNLSFDTSAIPEPAAATNKITYGKIYAFSIPRGAVNPSGGLTAAIALLSAANDASAAGATGLAPALRSDLASEPANSLAATSYSSALYAAGWLSPAPADTDPVFSSMITSVNSGQLSISSALANAQAALTALLQK